MPVIAEQQVAEPSEIIGDGDIFELDRRNGQPAFQQRHGEAIDIAQVRITGCGFTALEHERITDQHTDARRAAIPLDARLLHVVERVYDGLKFSGVLRRDRLPLREGGRTRVTAPKDALGPGRNFKLPDIRLKQ